MQIQIQTDLLRASYITKKHKNILTAIRDLLTCWQDPVTGGCYYTHLTKKVYCNIEVILQQRVIAYYIYDRVMSLYNQC